MQPKKNPFYVYVYIDPRNFQEFYYGKGQGLRKFSHLHVADDGSKGKIIKAIKAAGLEPIIRVIAADLTEQEALLVEKTLIWKLGKNLSNKSSGHFSEKFRPHDSLHKELFGFDFSNGVFYVNVGEGDARNWDDCSKFGFLSAGQDWQKWGSKLYRLKCGDIVIPYLKKNGYVGVGRVIKEACPVLEFKYKGKNLDIQKLSQPNLALLNAKNPHKCEHLVAIDWIVSVPRGCAKKASKKLNFFTTQQVVDSLEKQEETLKYLEKEFKVSFAALLNDELDSMRKPIII